MKTKTGAKYDIFFDRKKNLQTGAYLDDLVNKDTNENCLCYDSNLSFFFTGSCHLKYCEWTDTIDRVHVSTKMRLHDLLFEEGFSLHTAQRLYFGVKDKQLLVMENPSSYYQWTGMTWIIGS